MLTLIALLLALTPAASNPQAASATPRPTLVSTGAFFALSVKNLDAAATWYADTLGMTRISQGGPQGDFGGFIVLEGGGLIVELLNHAKSARPAGGLEQIQGIAKVGVVVNNFDSAVAALRARGVSVVFGPLPAQGNVPANFAFRDPEGNIIQLFAGRTIRVGGEPPR